MNAVEEPTRVARSAMGSLAQIRPELYIQGTSARPTSRKCLKPVAAPDMRSRPSAHFGGPTTPEPPA